MRRDAVAHAIAAGDADEATRLIAVEGRVAFEAGELATLRAWLESLPPRATEQTPTSSCSTRGRSSTRDAWPTPPRSPGATSPRRGRGVRPRDACWCSRRCSRRRRAPEAEALAREGIALLDGDPLFESLGLQAAGLAQLARGDVAASLGTLRDAFARALAVGHPMAVLPAVNPLGHALEATGRRDEAEALARRVLAEYRGPVRGTAADRLVGTARARDRPVRGRGGGRGAARAGARPRGRRG